MSARKIVIPERPGRGRLGRHVHHDLRSHAFTYAAAPGKLASRKWDRFCDPFDQGELGSCTCNAMGGVLMTAPFYKPGRNIVEADCVHLYEQATRLDGIAGHWPPDDTGSTGLAAAHAAKNAGFIPSYRHAFGLQATLAAISKTGPILLGINWYAGFDTPKGRNAELVIGGEVRGGHEVEINEVDVDRKLVRGPNSWGVGWGDHGYFTLAFGTLERLLAEHGDVVVPSAS